MLGEQSVSASCFAENLGHLIELTGAESAALEKLEGRQRQLRRGAILLREKERGNELFILRKGMMMSYVILDDGSRQILRFMFPGDLLGSALIYRDAPETLCALSDAVVAPFERNLLVPIFDEHPRLAALLLVYNNIQRVALTDRLAALGRTSAKARIAALLLELRNRLRRADSSVTNGFALGLTQEEIGDATGLTSVHVNRMLRQLEQEGMIARESGRVTLLDENSLRREANYVNRYEGLDLGWLPSPR
ncbi:Crp/Fnr family transcriptional regulator [Stakelama tenebrarum]|uniref:Crp/Fnr family transcriptional regulator n=1 Tax=Stakelama tenebrarum TaxID=2711215 RepID=A0A6G6YBU1_9SPHN|nr:Crp/Fnr family transcriptional regulator [Sphingosinithalassobacter tenebrarum]QIG82053.1 Crp/Fnr family transcriptional regulator [Sphingosinithalassobacter tenebrarum]